MRIIVKDTINTNFAVSTEDGNAIFELLNENFLHDNLVLLDFSGITLMTTAFLNSAIGQLYSSDKYSGNFLNEKLKLREKILEEQEEKERQEYDRLSLKFNKTGNLK